MYIAGQDESSQNLNAYKFSSTFTSTYLRRLKVVGSFSYPSGGYPRGAVDSAGAMYVSGFYDQSSCCISIRRAILIKLGTGGTTTSWANSLDFSGGSTRSTYTTNCAVDSAGNVIVVGYSSFGSGIYIIKYTSAGAISWQRKFAGASEANSVAVDSSNNIYVVASNGYILKYNSSGVLQFQRVLTITQTGYTNAYLNLRSIFISGTNMYICGSTATVPYDGAQACGLVLSLPVDGSKTGTFPVVDTKTVTYSTGTGTDSAQTLTNTSVSITNAAYTPTVGSTSKMYSTLSFTYNKGSV